MPKKVFLKRIPGRETDERWLQRQISGKKDWAPKLAPFADELRRAQRKLLLRDGRDGPHDSPDQGDQPRHVDR